jgi:molecular chaperone DnaK
LKRLLGCRGAELEDLGNSFPCPLDRAGPSDLVRVAAGQRLWMPQEVLAARLCRLRRDAEQELGRPARRAVITVPAAFNDAQRQAVLEAARAAGFDATWDITDPNAGKSTRVAMRLLSEPVAAAVAFARQRDAPGKLAVVNFGGGHLDVAVVDAGDGLFRVEVVAGDTRLGGDDLDRVVLDWIADEFKKEHGADMRKDAAAVPRLREAAEAAKKELSQRAETEIVLPFIAADAAGPKHLQVNLTRARFERMVAPLLERCRAVLGRALKDVRRGAADIDEVVLVGGMTEVPCVRQVVREVFGREGTAVPGAGGLAASGAAIVGANLLRGSQADVLVIDVVPLTLGIETLGGVMHPVIERNATLPVERKQLFSTAEDNQSAVTVKVFQGERPMAADNRLLGEFNLGGIARAPRGVPQIEVCLSLDANGMLKVSARDLGTGKENTIRIEGSSRLPEAEIERLRRDVERLVF